MMASLSRRRFDSKLVRLKAGCDVYRPEGCDGFDSKLVRLKGES